MAPFQPLGERARWKVIYEMLRMAETGEIVTYEQLGEALDLNPLKDRHTLQMAMRRAAREHEVTDKRAIDVISNVGYKIVPAPENLRLARNYQQRASKSLVRGQSKVVNVDLAGVDPETRHAFEVVGRAFAMQMDFNRRLDVRQSKLEDAISAMSERTERSAEEIAELKGRLARLERNGNSDSI